MAKNYTVLTTSGERAALYIDGKLDRHGDKYTIDERLYDIFGIDTEYTHDWIRNEGTKQETIAQTLAEVDEYRQEKENARNRIEQLEEEIARLRQL